VRRFFEAQRLIVVLVVASIVAALAIGLWPVTANVFGDASYSCGSGFLHSAHTWTVDSQTLRFDRIADGTATGTPAVVCPTKVYNRRDYALLVVAFGLAIALIAQITFERPRARARGYQSTMFVNRRVGTARPRSRRAHSDESTVQ
jgi:hypothetical protein